MTAAMPEKPGSESRVPGKARRKLRRIMIYILVIYLSWLVTAYLVQRSILFPRSLIPVDAQAGPPKDAHVLYVDAPGGKVEAWLIMGDGVSAEKPGPVVIFAHGNGELIDHWPDMLAGYTRMGVSVLLPEYRGYGRSAGGPSQRAIGEDYAKFYDQVIERPEVDPSRVVLHGRSIGGGVAAQLASDRPSAALILQSSPSSINRMAARFLVPWFLVRDPFDAVAVVRDYEQPVLIMHGSADRIVPPSHGRRLADAAADGKLIFYGVDHNTLPTAGPYWRDIEQFLKDAGVLE